MKNKHPSSGILSLNFTIKHHHTTQRTTLQPSSVVCNTITCVVTTTNLSCFKSFYNNHQQQSNFIATQIKHHFIKKVNQAKYYFCFI